MRFSPCFLYKGTKPSLLGPGSASPDCPRQWDLLLGEFVAAFGSERKPDELPNTPAAQARAERGQNHEAMKRLGLTVAPADGWTQVWGFCLCSVHSSAVQKPSSSVQTLTALAELGQRMSQLVRNKGPIGKFKLL